MSKRKVIFLCLIVLSLSPPHAFAWEIDKQSKVTEIIDGDSFYTTDDEVRLADIDAPELGQEGYDDAKDALEHLIEGKNVYLDTDQISGRDQYDRQIAVIYVKHNSTHYKNVNYFLWKVQKVVEKEDYTDNEFDPLTWKRFVRYTESPDPPPPRPDKYDLITIVKGLGTINHSIGLTKYKEDTTITITAIPEKKWRLLNWQKNGQNAGTSDSITFKMSNDIELVVSFEEISADCSITFYVLNENKTTVDLVNIASLTFPEFQKNITLVTGFDGVIQSDYLYPGNYSFKLFKHGHETTQFELSLKKEEAKVQSTLLLWKKVDISITITDTDEKIVKNIQVKSVQQPEHQQAIHGFTNEDGVAVFEDVLPGKYIFEIVGEYVETENIAINTTLNSSSYSISEDVQLLCTLYGRIEDDKGNPLEDVRVSIVQQSDGNEILNFTCDREYSIFGIYPGSYNIFFNKVAYENVSVSLNLATYGLHPLRTVALMPITPNFTPYYVVGVIASSVILVSYLGYTKRLRIFDKPDYFGPEWQDIEKEYGVKLEQDVKPLYFGTDKGAIIKTICVDNYHTLSDILEHSGLEEDEFWDNLYELLSEGVLETTESDLYVVRNDIKKQWLTCR